MEIRIIYKIVITIILINCFSCNFVAKNDKIIEPIKEMVTIYDYQLYIYDLDKKELRDSIVVYIDTLYFCNRKNCIFALDDSITIDYGYSIEKDSFFLYDLYCPILDTVCLKYKNENIKAIVSHYDEENSIDEEMYVYWNDDYGLIGLYNYPCGALILFDKESIKGFAKEILYNYIINTEKERKCLWK